MYRSNWTCAKKPIEAIPGSHRSVGVCASSKSRVYVGHAESSQCAASRLTRDGTHLLSVVRIARDAPETYPFSVPRRGSPSRSRPSDSFTVHRDSEAEIRPRDVGVGWDEGNGTRCRRVLGHLEENDREVESDVARSEIGEPRRPWSRGRSTKICSVDSKRVDPLGLFRVGWLRANGS